MQGQQAIPVIQHSDLPGMQSCNGCGSEENVKQYRLRTGETTMFSIAWCNKCARQVATFLLKPERSR